MLKKTLELTEMMVELADRGDGAREDVGCGVLYGLLRDSAYKIRKVAEDEMEAHVKKGWLPASGKTAKRGAAGMVPRGVENNLNTGIIGGK